MFSQPNKHPPASIQLFTDADAEMLRSVSEISALVVSRRVAMDW